MSDAALWILVGIPIGGLVVGIIGYALSRPEPELELIRGHTESGREVLLCLDVQRGTARELDLRWSGDRVRRFGVHGLPSGASEELRHRAERLLWKQDRYAPPDRPPPPTNTKVRDAS